jgi:FkbM family methyltransferase
VGHLPEKYTRSYFLGAASANGEVSYGVEGVSEFLAGEIRAHDKSILEAVNFDGARVFEIGYGRGEAAKYAIDRGASVYLGVDFSQDACQIATEHLARFGFSDRGKFICADIVPFLENASEDHRFDVVLMLDVIEHIPRVEFDRLLSLLPRIMSERGMVVVNTPVYRHDNDVLADGIDERNHADALDLADFIPETAGMHCNKYTLESLNASFARCGFNCFSRGHYFGLGAPLWPADLAPGSYQRMWSAAHKAGIRIVEAWRPEAFEYAYVGSRPEPRTFTRGPLAGRTLLVEPDWVDPFEHESFDERLVEFLTDKIKPGRVIFDIGAYIGTHSLALASLSGARVVAFEPNPSNLDRLRQNVSANPDLSDLIDVVPLAVSNGSGVSDFQLHDNVAQGYASGSHLAEVPTTERPATYQALGFKTTQVRTVALDDFVTANKVVPERIKVDIEGAEYLALEGARRLLSGHHPQVFVEVHSARAAVLVLDELANADYTHEVLATEPDGRVLLGCAAREEHGGLYQAGS